MNKLTPDEINQAREWIKDCVWPDLEDYEIDDLSDEQITNGIKRHYGGGLAEFKRNCQ